MIRAVILPDRALHLLHELGGDLDPVVFLRMLAGGGENLRLGSQCLESAPRDQPHFGLGIAKEELGVSPSAETEALYLKLLRDS